MEFSLLETMRLDEGAIVRLERHLARLAASARHFGYALRRGPDSRGASRRPRPRIRTGRWRVRLLVVATATPTIECTPYAR